MQSDNAFDKHTIFQVSLARLMRALEPVEKGGAAGEEKAEGVKKAD
jgi:hypothetical protein